MLPVRKHALPVKRSQLRVPEPDRWKVGCGSARPGCHLDADHPIFATIPLGSLDAEFVESS